MKKLKIIGILLLIAAVVGGMYIYPKAALYFYGNKKINTTKETAFYVPTNASLEEVITKLKNDNVITDVEGFKGYAEARNLKQQTLEPGKYVFSKGATYSSVLEALRKGNGEKEVKVTFNNARTKKDLAEKMAANLELTSDVILQYLYDENFAQEYGFTKETITTMFIPNTYNAYWDISAEDLMKKMAKEYKRFWTAERKQKAKKLGLSQAKVAILASIVNCETQKMDEAPTIAGVYVNRLKKGMKLDADPTLVWAWGDFTIKRILNKHKELDSPYNTYIYAGLPPGPIYVPSSKYIDAVLNYDKHEYLFFCAKEDFSGYANFAKTYRQHLVNARKYQRALDKRKLFR